MRNQSIGAVIIAGESVAHVPYTAVRIVMKGFV
jgi:hypothetical protein